MEMADAHRMDSGADQLFLATAVQRELGQRNWTRTTGNAALGLFGGLLDRGSVTGLLADSLAIKAMGGEGARLT